MKIKTVKEVGEFECIRRISKNFIYRPELVKLGSGDDAAVYSIPDGFDEVISTDTMVEGIHFLSSTMSPCDVGYRICAVNFSDVAAMGGSPIGIVFSVALPDDVSMSWVESCYDGIRQACQKYRVNILGGDITGSRQGVVITGTVVGIVKKDCYITRSGASVGDVVFVTGTLGDSAAGLASILAHRENEYLSQRHRRPDLRVAWGECFSTLGVHALNDISDGLSRELYEIAVASRVDIQIDASCIPISSQAREMAKVLGKNPLEWALNGGEDYELVGTASTAVWNQLKSKTGITNIGQVTCGGKGKVDIVDKGEIRTLEVRGYDHFIK